MKKPVAKPRRTGRPAAAPPTELGRRIRAARERRRLTIAACAAALDLTENAWRAWEMGRRQPKFDSLKKIAAALDLPLARLIDL